MRSANIASKRYESIRIEPELLNLDNIICRDSTSYIHYTMIFNIPADDREIDEDDFSFSADLLTIEAEPADVPDPSQLCTAITIRTTGHTVPAGVQHGTYRLLVNHTSFVDVIPPTMLDDSIELEPLGEPLDETAVEIG